MLPAYYTMLFGGFAGKWSRCHIVDCDIGIYRSDGTGSELPMRLNRPRPFLSSWKIITTCAD